MHECDIDKALSTLTLLYDTREQLNERLQDRLSKAQLPCERVKLDYGDYSAKCEALDLRNSVVIERKMNLDELAMCLGSQRKRFEAEFKRAKDQGATVYLLIEDANWDVLYSPQSYKLRCHSKYTAKAMIASLTAFMSRYGLKVIFCNESNSGYLIREILFREMKERLKSV